MLVALILWSVNWRAQTKQATGGRIWLVPAVALVVVVLPCVALLWVPKTVVGAPAHEWEADHTLAVLAMAALASAIFTVMWLSSVVDRCYILPRLRAGRARGPAPTRWIAVGTG